jgi:hypothetical protein
MYQFLNKAPRSVENIYGFQDPDTTYVPVIRTFTYVIAVPDLHDYLSFCGEGRGW